MFTVPLQLEREVFLIVDNGTKMPWLPQLATRMSYQGGGALSIVNIDKVATCNMEVSDNAFMNMLTCRFMKTSNCLLLAGDLSFGSLCRRYNHLLPIFITFKLLTFKENFDKVLLMMDSTIIQTPTFINAGIWLKQVTVVNYLK